MKRNVIAVLSAVMVLTLGTVTAFAASPTTGTAEAVVSSQTAMTSVTKTASPAEYVSATTASAGFDVEEVPATIVEAAAVAVQNSLLNNVASVGGMLNNSELAAAAADPNKKVTAEMLTVVEVNPTSASKDANGNYVVTLNLSSISAGDIIAVLHYNGSSWDTIAPDRVSAGKVVFSTPSLSPISVVKLEVTDVKAAPKTGTAMPAAIMLVVVGLAGMGVCGKKYFA